MLRLETITNESNAQLIYSETKRMKSRFPKAEVVTLFCLATISVTGSSNNSDSRNSRNQVMFSNTSENSQQIGKFEPKELTEYDISVKDRREADAMSDVTHRDLTDTEHYIFDTVNRRFDSLDSSIKSENSKIDKLNEKVSAAELSLSSIDQQIKDLPDKLKASRWDIFISKILVPLIVGVLGAIFGAKFL